MGVASDGAGGRGRKGGGGEKTVNDPAYKYHRRVDPGFRGRVTRHCLQVWYQVPDTSTQGYTWT